MVVPALTSSVQQNQNVEILVSHGGQKSLNYGVITLLTCLGSMLSILQSILQTINVCT